MHINKWMKCLRLYFPQPGPHVLYCYRTSEPNTVDDEEDGKMILDEKRHLSSGIRSQIHSSDIVKGIWLGPGIPAGADITLVPLTCIPYMVATAEQLHPTLELCLVLPLPYSGFDDFQQRSEESATKHLNRINPQVLLTPTESDCLYEDFRCHHIDPIPRRIENCRYHRLESLYIVSDSDSELYVAVDSEWTGLLCSDHGVFWDVFAWKSIWWFRLERLQGLCFSQFWGLCFKE